MNKTRINIQEERDFGDLFNTTFAFIGSEFKPLGKALLSYVLPFLILSSILMVFTGVEQQKAMSSVQGNGAVDDPMLFAKNMGMYGGLSMIILLFAVTSLNCIVIGYIKLYAEGGSESINTSDLWKQLSSNFWKVFGASILAGIVIMIGSIFCLLPGIYLGVSLSLMLPIIIIERSSIDTAFGRSFKLIKSKFWMTLGMLIIVYVIIYILTIIFSIPAMLAGLKPLLTNISNAQSGEPMVFGIWYYILNSVTTVITYALTAIPMIMLTLHYYSQIEATEKPSLSTKIDAISENE